MSELNFRIKKIEFVSFREFEGIEMKFSSGTNFLQIRNGYGKTTTLDVLRNMYTDLLPDDPINFPKYKRLPETAGHDAETKTVITLHLDIEQLIEGSLDMTPWRLSAHYDHTEGRAWFETESPQIGGHEEGWHLPNSFKAKFWRKPNFASLYLFDGETARELAEQQDHEQVVNAIREVTGVRSVYQHVEDGGYLDEDRNKALKDAGVKNLEASHVLWLGFLDNLEDHMEEVEAKRTENKKAISTLAARITLNESKIKTLGVTGDNTKHLKRLEKDRRTTKKELNALTLDLLSELGNPCNMTNLWEKVRAYNSELVKKKLPEGVGRNFFKDLAAEDNKLCVCGRPLDKEHRRKIDEQAERFLDDNVLTIVNTMQTEVADHKPGVDILANIRQKIIDKRDEITEIDEEISAISDVDDPELKKKVDDLKSKVKIDKEDLKTKKAEVEEIEETDPTIIQDNDWGCRSSEKPYKLYIQPNRFKKCENLKELKEIEKDLQTRLGDTGPLANLNTGTDTAKRIIQEALNKVMDDIYGELQDNTQNKLDTMGAQGGRLLIDLGHTGFIFSDELGKPQPKANQGAVLSAAYCFISAMSELSDSEIPLIGDSPITGFDSFSAAAWVEHIWPSFKQTIFLATPGERGIIMEMSEDALKAEEVKKITVCRVDEAEDGQPQSGKMFAGTDEEWESFDGRKDWFFRYAAKKSKK